MKLPVKKGLENSPFFFDTGKRRTARKSIELTTGKLVSSTGDIANNSNPQRMGRQSFWGSLMELLGSMRFAISLLTLIC
ncbi:MAG: hypothetical protein ACK5Q1_07915, partial [Limnobacter sp.]